MSDAIVHRLLSGTLFLALVISSGCARSSDTNAGARSSAPRNPIRSSTGDSPPGGEVDARLRSAAWARVVAATAPAYAPAVTVGVIDGAREVTYGFGKSTTSNGESTPSDQTVYLIGSITKVFTGLLLGQAVLDRAAALDSPVNGLLPKQPATPQFGNAPIRLIDLATHTAGLPMMFENWRPSDDELLRLLSALKLESAPGTKFEYSNIGYAVLGRAVAATWGEDFETALKRHVLQPLGLRSTGFMWTNRTANRAEGYDAEGRVVPRSVNVPTMAGCCVLESTGSDLLRFARHYIDGTIDRRLIELTAKGYVQGSGGYDNVLSGLGWFIRLPEGRLWKNGFMEGFRSSIVIDLAKKRAVVVLANQSEFDADAVAFGVLRDLELLRMPTSAPPIVQGLPADAQEAHVVYDDNLELVGYKVAPNANVGGSFKATLYWRKNGAVRNDYRVYVHGESVGSVHRLHGDHYPPQSIQSWPVGPIVEDSFSVPVPSHVRRGDWQLSFGLYEGGHRLRVLSSCNEPTCRPKVQVQ
jgi:serine-type D-Ala-D-Ala carboxypeptidase/endopeptidase